MLYKALGFIASLFPMGWGIHSMNAGLNSIEFGPVLGGAMFFTFGLIVAVVIIISIAEQIVNNPTVSNFKDCGCYYDIDCKCMPYPDFNALNTPDPQLVHPDYAKRRRGSEATHPTDAKRERDQWKRDNFTEHYATGSKPLRERLNIKV